MGAQQASEVLVPNLDTAFIRDGNGQAVASIYGANGACHQDPTSTARTLLFTAAPELKGVAENFAITGPDDDGLIWLVLHGNGATGMAVINLGRATGLAGQVALALEQDRCAALAKARGMA